MIKVTRYTKELRNEWDRVVESSRNSTFFFKRSYMDYHSDRFTDHSLIIYNDDKPVALFPANESNGKITSHGGLTFGGLLLSKEIKLKDVLGIFYHLLLYYHNNGFAEVIYKTIPSFYHLENSQEDLYAMFLLNAELIRRDVGFVYEASSAMPYQERRVRSIKKGIKLQIEVKADNDLEKFWKEILEPNLQERFGIKPVHSLEEMQKLKQDNPENIVQYNAYLNGQIQAGSTVFINSTSAHAQYISSSTEGRNSGAIDLLFDQMIKDFSHLRFFSFGIANENQGRDLNYGLTDWKEGFAARVWPQDFYKINTQNFSLLETYKEL